MDEQNIDSWQGPVFLAFVFCFLFSFSFFTYKKVDYGRSIASFETMDKYIYNFSYKF